METSFKEGKPESKWIRKFLKRNKLTMQKVEMISTSRIRNTSNPFVAYDLYDALVKVFTHSMRLQYEVYYAYSYSVSRYN